MESAFNDGYFPPDLALGMETGWTLQEIRDLDPLVKRMYIEFLLLKKKKTQKEIDDLKNDMEAKMGKGPSGKEQVISFIDEDEFVSKIR